jgi:hypothetical protein
LDTVTPAAVPTALDPESVGEAIRHAQAELERSVQQANLSKDPLRLPLGALSVTLGALHQLFIANVEQSRSMAEDLNRRATEIARHPIDPKVLETLTTAAVTGADRKAAALMHQHRRNTTLATALSIVIPATLALMAGYVWGHTSAARSIHETEAGLDAAFSSGPDSAVAWMSLMQLNDAQKVIAACTGDRLYRDPSGRRACSAPLWLEPLAAAAPPHKG